MLEYNKELITIYSKIQEKEFELERTSGFSAVKHKSFVGAGYFDQIQTIVSGGLVSTYFHRDVL